MKKVSIIIVVVIAMINNLNAQENLSESGNSPKNSLRVHPVHAALKVVKIDYERMIKPKGSLEFRFTYANLDWVDLGSSFRGYTGDVILFNAGYKFYVSKKKKGPRGFFLRPGIVAGYFSIKDEIGSDDPQTIAIGFGGEVGYQWVFKKFLKGLTIGTSFETNKYFFKDKESSTRRDGFDSVIPELNISIGYSW